MKEENIRRMIADKLPKNKHHLIAQKHIEEASKLTRNGQGFNVKYNPETGHMEDTDEPYDGAPGYYQWQQEYIIDKPESIDILSITIS